MAERREHADVIAELHAILRAHFGDAHGKRCTRWETQPGVTFDAQHHGGLVSLNVNASAATWPVGDSCDQVVLIAAPNGTRSFWTVVNNDGGGYVDVGFCTPDVDLSGKVWMGHQLGKAWVYRASAKFADSWITHGKGHTPAAQGVKYGKPFAAGDRVGATWINASALEFSLNGRSMGVVATAQPMPVDVVGCAGVCNGGALATDGCVWNWTTTE